MKRAVKQVRDAGEIVEALGVTVVINARATFACSDRVMDALAARIAVTKWQGT